jgi:uncharacterized membrane protein YoaK (UPF0700 family)
MPMPGRRLGALVAVLAMTAGATDAISFLGLGGVFSSVMTANMVLLGLGAGQQNVQLTVHTGAALAGYIVGAVVVGRLTWPPGRQAGGWPAPLVAALIAESIMLAGVTVGWEIVGGHPRGAAQVALLAGTAAAMGSQGAAVKALQIPEISSTYMTGMLTGILADLAAPAGPAVASRLRLIAMLIVGATASGITYAQVPRLAPLIPVASLACVIGIAVGARTRTAGPRDDPQGSDQRPG